MGLIRKTLSIGTIGVVKGSSKKQRMARATLEEMQRQTAVLERQGAVLDGSAGAAAKSKAKHDANAAIAKAQRAALKSPTPENLEQLSIAYALAGRPLAFGRTGLEGLERSGAIRIAVRSPPQSRGSRMAAALFLARATRSAVVASPGPWKLPG